MFVRPTDDIGRFRRRVLTEFTCGVIGDDMEAQCQVIETLLQSPETICSRAPIVLCFVPDNADLLRTCARLVPPSFIFRDQGPDGDQQIVAVLDRVKLRQNVVRRLPPPVVGFDPTVLLIFDSCLMRLQHRPTVRFFTRCGRFVRSAILLVCATGQLTRQLHQRLDWVLMCHSNPVGPSGHGNRDSHGDQSNYGGHGDDGNQSNQSHHRGHGDHGGISCASGTGASGAGASGDGVHSGQRRCWLLPHPLCDLHDDRNRWHPASAVLGIRPMPQPPSSVVLATRRTKQLWRWHAHYAVPRPVGDTVWLVDGDGVWFSTETWASTRPVWSHRYVLDSDPSQAFLVGRERWAAVAAPLPLPMRSRYESARRCWHTMAALQRCLCLDACRLVWSYCLSCATS